MFYSLIRSSLAVCLALIPVPSPACGDQAPFPDKMQPVSLEQNVGREVTLVGEVALIPHAHMISLPPGEKPQINYIDLYQGGQLVVYFPTAIICPGPISVTGTVQKVSGQGKGSQANKTFVEYQLAATGWVCFGQRIEEVIAELGNDRVPMAAKESMRQQLAGEGMLAVPVLIAHLNDGRIYEKQRDVQNYYAMPPHLPPPPPIYADIPVGDICREILYDIITPRYESPYFKPIKPYSFSMFSVPDWKLWWQKNKSKTLAQVHEEMKPLVDKYWQEHGTEQVIE